MAQQLLSVTVAPLCLPPQLLGPHPPGSQISLTLLNRNEIGVIKPVSTSSKTLIKDRQHAAALPRLSCTPHPWRLRKMRSHVPGPSSPARYSGEVPFSGLTYFSFCRSDTFGRSLRLPRWVAVAPRFEPIGPRRRSRLVSFVDEASTRALISSPPCL
jgi:hypothetical protein